MTRPNWAVLDDGKLHSVHDAARDAKRAAREAGGRVVAIEPNGLGVYPDLTIGRPAYDDGGALSWEAPRTRGSGESRRVFLRLKPDEAAQLEAAGRDHASGMSGVVRDGLRAIGVL